MDAVVRRTIFGVTGLLLAIAAGAGPLSAQTADPGVSPVANAESQDTAPAAAIAGMTGALETAGMAGIAGTGEAPGMAAAVPAAGTSCLDASAAPAGVPYLGRLYEPLGGPEPILPENLLRVGEHEGVPLYVGRLATRPYVDIWLPTCHPPGLYRLFTLEHQVGR